MSATVRPAADTADMRTLGSGTVHDETFGEALRRLRGTLSVRDVAAMAHCGKSMVSDLENGKRRPTRAIASALDDALNAQGQLADLCERPPGTPISQRAAALQTGLMDQLAAGPMTDASLDEWSFTVARHGRATRYRPEHELLADLVADFADLQTLLKHRHPPAARRRLLTVCAQLAGLMALTHLKLGDPQARSWWRTGRAAAAQAEDRPTLAWIYAHESYQLFYEGDLAGAVELAIHAQQLAGGMPCVADALAAPLEARAQALQGRRPEVLDALSRAETATARLGSEDRQPSALGYDEAQLAFHSGNAWTSLHDTPRAWEQQQRALDLYPPENRTDRTLIALDRAACIAYDGDHATGAQMTTDSVLALPEEHRSALILSRARDLAISVPGKDRQLPEVRVLREVLALPSGQ